jgi:hypothetical protein
MNSALHELMNVIDAAELEPENFAGDAFTLHALSIAKLPPEERERALLKIDCGELRAAVSKFERPSYPKPNGHGGMQ